MDFENLINGLIELESEIEPNFENFDTAIDNWNGIILKINNMKNNSKNKITFVGRCGSMKNELILNLIKLKLSPFSLSKIKNKYIEYISENNNYGILGDYKTEPIEFESVDLLDEYIKSNYSIFSSHIKIFYPRSEYEILKDKILMDTPFYDYSDEKDDEIVNNCRDGQIFFLVLDAVEAIGYRDKNFLKLLSGINFIKLIFIFNCMEQVSNENYHRTKGQHETNAIRISNEILIPSQENIPIIFIKNCQMNEDELQWLLANTDFNENTMKDYVERIKQEINQATDLIATKKEEIDQIVNQKEKEFRDYEKERKKADEENNINKKKNEHIKKLQELINFVVNLEIKITTNFKNSIYLYESFLESYSEIASKQGYEFIEGIEPEEEKSSMTFGAIKHAGYNIYSYLNENMNNGWKRHNPENDWCTIKTLIEFLIFSIKNNQEDNNWKDLIKELSERYETGKSIDALLQQNLNKLIDEHNAFVCQTSHDNEMRNCGNKMNKIHQAYYNTDTTKNKNEISKLIENILQNIKSIPDFPKHFITMLNYLKDDTVVISSENFPDISGFLDELIEKIELTEIEKFHTYLDIIFWTKILLKILIEQENIKSSKRWYSSPNYSMNRLNTLKKFLEHLKFDKFKEITLPNYEITTKYSKSQSDSLEDIILQNKKKSDILEKAEKRFNEKLNKLF